MNIIDPNEFCQKWIDTIVAIDADALQVDTVFKKLPVWDSLMLLLTVAMVESEYGVTLRSVDFDEAETVADLLMLIQQRMQSA